VAVTTSGALSGKTVKSMVQGQSHTCVIASDNNAYCWGRNNQGQLGNGTTSDSSVPVAVSMSGLLSGKTIKSISAGHAYTCVIASDNNAYCWGYNGDGQLGNNSTVNSTQPVLVDSSVFSS
jgi:alpha-tubulin suppressor-like RCC1 family protein